MVLIFLVTLLMGFSFDAHATRRNICNSQMQAVEVQQMNFGDFAPAGGGTVTVTPVGARLASGVTLLGGTVNAGIINVSTPAFLDCYCYPLEITIRSTTTLDSPTDSMPLSNIVTNPASETVTVPKDQALSVNVGADIAVAPAQTAGTYNTATPYVIRFRFLRDSVGNGNRCPG
jgi:hypothetical protein